MLASGTAHKKCRIIRYIWPGPRAFLRDTLVATSIQPAARPSQADGGRGPTPRSAVPDPPRPRGQGDPEDSSLPSQWPWLFFLPAGRSLHRGLGRTPERGGKRAAALNQADGTFEVPGPDGRGIPPGKYRVSVTQNIGPGTRSTGPRSSGTAPIDRDTDLLGGPLQPDRLAPSSSR